MSLPLLGKVTVVTGATRGVGKGIAVQLASAGAKVYVTGRTLKSNNAGNESLEDTVAEIKKRGGGEGFAVQVDHEKDKDIEELFNRINKEQNGQLDILVNNAHKGGETLFENLNTKFWERDPREWDNMNNVGLRNHYFCTVYASRLMVPRKKGLIVNITSLGGLNYSFNPAYGIGKCAVDRMVGDCGIELRKQNVATVGLLLGVVKTESTLRILETRGDVQVPLDPNNPFLSSVSLKQSLKDAESTEFAGKCIVALAQEPNLMKYTSKILSAADYAQSKGIRDIDGRVVPSHRQINALVSLVMPKLSFVNKIIPNFVKVPQFTIDVATKKY